jgi:hypothetical protein
MKIRTTILSVFALVIAGALAPAHAQPKKPNILVIWGDDVGYWNISAYNLGMMGYRTPNIDRIAKEGALFTDWYGQQSCTAGRASFITGQVGFRTGMLKVGLPGATISATSTSTCRPRTASTNSSARSITSTRKTSPSIRTTSRIRRCASATPPAA